MSKRYHLQFYSGVSYSHHADPIDLNAEGVTSVETITCTKKDAIARAREMAALVVYPGLAGKAWVNIFLFDQKTQPTPDGGSQIATRLVFLQSFLNEGASVVASSVEQKLDLVAPGEKAPKRKAKKTLGGGGYE